MRASRSSGPPTRQVSIVPRRFSGTLPHTTRNGARSQSSVVVGRSTPNVYCSSLVSSRRQHGLLARSDTGALLRPSRSTREPCSVVDPRHQWAQRSRLPTAVNQCRSIGTVQRSDYPGKRVFLTPMTSASSSSMLISSIVSSVHPGV